MEGRGKEEGEGGGQAGNVGQASKVVSKAYCPGQGFPSLWWEQREKAIDPRA